MSPAELRAEMALVAAGAGGVEERAQALLGCLHEVLPFSAAWLAVRDPETRMHRRVGSCGDTDPLSRYFALPEADVEVEQLGLNRYRPPVPASALPVPLAETRAWGDFLLPAGFEDGVAVGVFSEDGRHLGFLSVLTHDRADRIGAHGGLLADLQPLFARALDRLPSFVAAAGMTTDALAGVVLTRSGRSLPLPTLPPHPLLEEGSPVLAVAREHLTSPGASASFLSPWAGSFVRISVLDFRDDEADHLRALVVVRHAGAAEGLERSDLQLLGGLVAGWDEERIRAGSGLHDVSGRAVRLACDLGLPDVGALVRHTAREGLQLPPALWQQP